MYTCMHAAGESIHDVDHDLRGICMLFAISTMINIYTTTCDLRYT